MKKISSISHTLKKDAVEDIVKDTMTMMQNGSFRWRHHWNSGTEDEYTRLSMSLRTQYDMKRKPSRGEHWNDKFLLHFSQIFFSLKILILEFN